MIDIPQPFWIAAFGVLLGATVSAIVRKRQDDQAAKIKARAIVGPGAPMSNADARKVVNTNETLQRTVNVLQDCNDAFTRQVTLLEQELQSTKADLAAALGRIGDLEQAIRTMTTVRVNKSRRIAAANADDPA